MCDVWVDWETDKKSKIQSRNFPLPPRRIYWIVLLLTMKSGYNSWIPNAKNRGIYLAKYQHRTARPNRFIKKMMSLICFDQKEILYNELLKPYETDNRHHYRQQLINLNHILREQQQKHDTSHIRVILQHDNVSCYHSRHIVAVFIYWQKYGKNV